MLVLMRRAGEKILITAGDVRITILIAEINANQVSVGVEAPMDVHVVRTELIDGHEWYPHKSRNKDGSTK